jgi:hypothetical protein
VWRGRRSAIAGWGQRFWSLVVCPGVGVLLAGLQGRRGLTVGEALVSVVLLPAGLAMFGGAVVRLRAADFGRMGLRAALVGLGIVAVFYVIVITGWALDRLE